MSQSRSRYGRRRARPRAGFTLIEVLLVMAILVILGSLAGGMFIRVKQNADVSAARAQIGLFKQPIHMFQLNTNQFPTTAQGLDALLNPPADLANANKWQGPYMDQNPLPLDPWGQPYQYMCPGRANPDTFDIWSVGPDGQDNTADDIGNWEAQ
jgi:general secretion pathway protein G